MTLTSPLLIMEEHIVQYMKAILATLIDFNIYLFTFKVTNRQQIADIDTLDMLEIFLHG